MVLNEIYASDFAFYSLIGLFMVVFFVVTMALLIGLDYVPLDRTLLPFGVGFALFILVYFISILVFFLRPQNDVR